ncbi:carbohydrate binding domain-containing protein [Maribacter sp. HTCC2170]|uniref:carbohydrate binding domain-containing protein n=1 Tax=Maribacter sp. (strain HTCC2170 / KCCM 42371) TaxID=313603 RepID=UPI00006B4987|nr:carbohydrate binding domain-containing protein [Maribacter sp. HTCC2170]
MNTNRNTKMKLSTRLPLLALIFGMGMICVIISCEIEDDIPPPSAYVAPEPLPIIEGCPEDPVVNDISAGIDFECGGPEIDFFGEKDGSLTIEFVENPNGSGINTSEKVVEYIQTTGVEPWAGFFFDLTGKVDFSEKQTIKVKVYSPAADQTVLLKLEDSADGSINKEVQGTTTVANEWEELSFAFSSSDSDKYDRLVLFFDFNSDKDADTTHYFDDITMAEGGAVEATEPTTSAPEPTLSESDVISIFSDTYTNVSGTDFNPDWGQATVTTQEDIDGNNTLKYGNLNYQGIALENSIDVSGMSFMHVDYWTADSTGFNGFLISPGPLEAPHAFTVTTGEWVGVDIPLSEFSSVVDLMDVVQMKFDGNGTIYLDNIYFHQGQPTGPTTAAPMPTLAESDVISIFSDTYTNVTGTNFNPDWGQATVTTQEDIDGNNTLKYGNLNYQGIALENSIDVSGMSFMHVDYWTADSAGFNGFLISSGPVETAHAFALTTGEWVSVDIPLTEFSGVVDLMDVIQMKFDGDGTIYLDNIYFHQGQPTGPTSAAPTPTVAEANVISVFSDDYTDVTGTDFNPNWGQATVVTQVDIAGDNTLKYENLNYQGTQFAAPLDISGMSMLHMDYWTADSSALNGFLISSGPVEIAYSFAITTGQWVSVDIPLTEFSGVVDLMDVVQMKFDGNGTIYLDNIYFYNAPATEPNSAAPTPTAAEADVISVFSDAYTDVSGTDFNPNWGQATVVTQVDVAGDNTLKYENLNYQGTQFAVPLDVSGMSMLHIDYWTADSSAFNGFLISSGPVETSHSFAITTGEWVSVDIPLTEFSGVVDLMDVIQMKFDGNGTVYFDNIYFYQ